MPRHAKGPRLYLRRGRIDARTGRPVPDLYYIRDGAKELGTGCGPDRLREAEQALARHIAAKWTPPARIAGSRSDPADVDVVEVLTLYLTERAPKLASPADAASRGRALLAWWRDKTVADVRRSTCEAYVAHRIAQPIASATKDPARARRVTDQGARRELEDLSAAITYWHGEHPLAVKPVVSLPEKPEGPRDALTRAQAAVLLRAARGARLGADGRWRRLGLSARANRAHLARFVLIGLYTGTRPGVIGRLLWDENPAHPWVDLENEQIFRRGRAERDHRTKRRPLVKIPRRLLAHLTRWRAADLRRWHAECKIAKDAGEELPPKPQAVVGHAGVSLKGRPRRAFASAISDAGLPREITPHWLRHTCATWLMERGVSFWDAAAFTGMSVKILEKHYAHHRSDHQAAARKAMAS